MATQLEEPAGQNAAAPGAHGRAASRHKKDPTASSHHPDVLLTTPIIVNTLTQNAVPLLRLMTSHTHTHTHTDGMKMALLT